MQIKELKDKYPLVYEAALKNKVEGDDTISIVRAFSWLESPEKEYFWNYIYKKNFDKAKEICPHLFELEESKKENTELEYKFKVGDQVKVIKNGYGCSSACLGEIVTILELGVYQNSRDPGYITTTTKNHSVNNTSDIEYHTHTIGERSFELYKPAESIVEEIKAYENGIININDIPKNTQMEPQRLDDKKRVLKTFEVGKWYTNPFYDVTLRTTDRKAIYFKVKVATQLRSVRNYWYNDFIFDEIADENWNIESVNLTQSNTDYEALMEPVEKPEENKSLVGRYFKALNDNIQGSCIIKGNYYQIVRVRENESCIGFFTEKYPKILLEITKNKFHTIQLMPEGFNPDNITPEPTVQEENQEDWIPQVGDWIVIIEGISKDSINYKGQVRKIREVESSFIMIEGDSSTGLWRKESGLNQEFRKALPHEIPKEDNSVVSGFPEEGCVYTSKEELLLLTQYLVNRPCNRAENSAGDGDVGIGWNKNSCWWLKTKTSTKPEYSLEQLKQFLPTSIITKEKTEKVDFIKGKWYRLKTNFDWYAKLLDFKDDEFTASEHIDIETSKIKKIGIWNKFIERGYTATLLTDLSEIQDYLPDGHPDKKDSTSNQVHVVTYPQLENCKRADVLTPFDIEKIFSNELSKKKKNYEIQTRLVTTDFTFKKKPKKTILSI